MPVRMIASDLDFTLLRNDRSISPYSLEVLRLCREKGILFIPSTARPPRTLAATGIEYDGALCHNGGVAVVGDDIVWERGIEPETGAALFGEIRALLPGLRLAAEMGGLLYANFPSEELWPGVEYLPTDFSRYPDAMAEKLMVILDDPGQAEAVSALLPRYDLSGKISEKALLMIQPAQVDKGSALLGLCEHLGIRPQEVVAFGDDWNDIPLLRAAGLGIAVENALPEVKAAADAVCSSNEEDGPARWLEEHLLG